MTIRVMPPGLVAQIKAGEVVERPASVVKELVENAIDAGARRIRVELVEGGTKLVRVVDDGAGIDGPELPLAFAAHTSSKVHSIAGLSEVRTLGFRGEALYAIAQVARVEAVSCLPEAAVGGCILIDHGELREEGPAAPGGGTRIAVHDLYAQVPARRKHLKSARSEAAAIHHVVAQYTIAYPATAFTLISEGKPLLSSPGTGVIQDAFGSVYGADIALKMWAVDLEGPVRVEGLISAPDVTRPNRTGIHLYANGRPIKSPALVFAVEEGYSRLATLGRDRGRHPLAAILITVPPDDLDPNVHPSKLEVRFLSDRAVFAAVRKAVDAALSSLDSVPTISSLTRMDGSSSGVTGSETLPDPIRAPYPDQISFPQASREPTSPNLGQVLPDLRVIGQSALTFVVAESTEGLYMVDQHAAHERILFDMMRDRGAEGMLSQHLLHSELLDLSDAQWSVLESHGDEVRKLGFDVAPFGDHACTVRSVPTAGTKPIPPGVLAEVLDALGEARSPEDVIDRGLTVVACKGAIKAGDELTVEEMKELLAQLQAAKHPRTCPHGRPTTIHISTEMLEREFGRR